MQTTLSADLKRLLDERQRHVDAANAIETKLRQIADLIRGGNGNGVVRPGRPRRALAPENGNAGTGSGNGAPVTLADHIEAVMNREAKPVAIPDLIAAVKAAGYKSRSKNLRPVISLALIKNPRFRRVGRGVYTLR